MSNVSDAKKSFEDAQAAFAATIPPLAQAEADAFAPWPERQAREYVREQSDVYQAASPEDRATFKGDVKRLGVEGAEAIRSGLLKFDQSPEQFLHGANTDPYAIVDEQVAALEKLLSKFGFRRGGGTRFTWYSEEGKPDFWSDAAKPANGEAREATRKTAGAVHAARRALSTAAKAEEERSALDDWDSSH